VPDLQSRPVKEGISRVTAKELLAALQAYYVELYQLGADREAVAIKMFIERLDK
jgi:hypothetical protein